MQGVLWRHFLLTLNQQPPGVTGLGQLWLGSCWCWAAAGVDAVAALLSRCWSACSCTGQAFQLLPVLKTTVGDPAGSGVQELGVHSTWACQVDRGTWDVYVYRTLC